MGKRTHQLTAYGITPTENDIYLECDKTSFTEAKKITTTQICEVETTRATTAEDTIEASTGLNTDGTYVSLSTSNYLKAADFAAAGLAENQSNADLLLDAKIKETELIDTGWIEFNYTEIISLRTTKQLLIAAPGANKYIVVEKVLGFNDFNTAAFDNGTDTLNVEYDSGQLIVQWPQTFIESAADLYQEAAKNAADTPINILNEAVYLRTSSADPTLGNAGSLIYIKLFYRIITKP